MNFKHMTFLCMQQLTNFPYIEEDFDALTNYELLCKVVEYLNSVIANENSQNDAINTLATNFNNLKNYVDNYFENLDVQDEINNKLDEMAESGTLQEIISDYLNSKAIFGFDNVESMQESTNLIDGSYARTLGYYSKNDGGSCLYKIREITNSDVIDNMLIIPLNDESLIAELIVPDIITPEMLGAKANGTDNDLTVFEKLITLNRQIKLNDKTYLLTSTLIVDSSTNINMVGNGQHSIIKYTGTGDAIQMSSSFIETERGNIPTTILKNIHFVSNRLSYANAIHIHGRENSILENIWIDGFNGNGLKIHSRESTFTNIRTRYNGDYENELSDILIYYDSSLGDRSNDIHFNNCEFIFSLYDILKTNNSSEILFDNCMFHNMPNAIMTDVYPNIYPDTDVTPTATYNTCCNANLVNSDSYAFSNCTFRIGGSNIIKLDNSPRNKMVNCNLSSFKLWDPTPSVVSATNSSSMLMNNITFGDIGYIFTADGSSNVIVGNHIIETSSANQNSSSSLQMKNYYPVYYPEITTETLKARYGNVVINGGRTGYSHWLIIQANNESNTATNCVVCSGSNTARRQMEFQNNTILKLSAGQTKEVSINAVDSTKTFSHNMGTTNFIAIVTPSWDTQVYITSKTSSQITVAFSTNAPADGNYIDILFFPV